MTPKKNKKEEISSDEEVTPSPKKVKTDKSPGKAYTSEESRQIVTLREIHKLTWAELSKHIPGRSAHSIQVSYNRIKSLAETFTGDDEIILAEAIAEDEKTRWKRIAKIVGKSDVGCRNKARQLGLSK